MPFTPTTGKVAVVKLTLGAGLADWIGPGINWKLDIDPKVVDKSNFRDGRIRNPTLQDAHLTLTLVYDQADSPFKVTGGHVLDGASGTAKLYTDATHYFSVPIILSAVGVEFGGVEEDLMLNVGFDLSSDGTNSTVTYPTGV